MDVYDFWQPQNTFTKMTAGGVAVNQNKIHSTFNRKKVNRKTKKSVLVSNDQSL